MNVKYTNLSERFRVNRKHYMRAFEEVLESGHFIGGNFLDNFEQEVANFLGVKHVVGVGSGTDALYLILKYQNFPKNSEIITVPNSYLATVSTIFLNGLKPIYAEIDPTTLQIDVSSVEKLITDNTVGIMGVHLMGSPCDIGGLHDICSRNGLKLFEDFSQSFGAKINKKFVGTLSDASAASLHPLKNLPCFGDGGIICTNDTNMHDWLKLARTHGHPHRDECDFWSFNMRLDAVHAALATENLKLVDSVFAKRRHLASIYIQNLTQISGVTVLTYDECMDHTFHTFVILVENRNELVRFLETQNVETAIHYQKLIPELNAHEKIAVSERSKNLNRQVLSLPISEEHTDDEIIFVCNQIRQFYLRG